MSLAMKPASFSAAVSAASLPLHGSKALPDLKKLLELYFYGALEERFEQEEGIKPTYEWYQDTLKR